MRLSHKEFRDLAWKFGRQTRIAIVAVPGHYSPKQGYEFVWS